MGIIYSSLRAAAAADARDRRAGARAAANATSTPSGIPIKDRRAASRIAAPSGPPAWAPRTRTSPAERTAPAAAEIAVREPAPPERPDAGAEVPAALRRAAERPGNISSGTGPDGLPDLAQTLDWVAHVLSYAGTLRRRVCGPCAEDGLTECMHAAALYPDILGWGSEQAVHLAAAWAAHTWARLPCRDTAHGHGADALGELVTPASPRLGIFAPDHGAGKTYLGKQLLRFCYSPTMEDEPTGPAIARMIGLEHATVAIDEGDILFGAGARKQMVRSLLNNGYTPGGHNSHASGPRGIARMSTYGPVLVCAIDSIEKSTGEALKPLLSRFIKMRLVKAPKGYRPSRMRANELAGIEPLVAHLKVRMAEPATLGAIARFEGDMPGYMEARTAEIWEPLYAVAHAAGGDWPARITSAADWFENGGEERARAAAAWGEAGVLGGLGR